MKLSFRLLARILFLLLVLVLLAVGGVLAWFTSWRSDRMAALDGASEVADTTYGRVEFVLRGEGPPVLVFHGAPGGYDQALLLGERLVDAGYQVVAPSRPGYLRTPLASGILPEQQADAMVALLDTLGLPAVTVLGTSAGAPAAIQFALRHPGRVRALVLLSPVIQRFDPRAEGNRAEFGRLMLNGLTGDIGSWLAVELAESDPRRMLEWMVERTFSGTATQREVVIQAVLQPSNEPQLEWFRGLLGTFAPLSPREAGARNDLLQMRALGKLPLETLTVPTLIVLGAQDACVPAAGVQTEAAKIPTCTVFTVPEAGHLVQLGPHAEEVHTKIVEFLNPLVAGESQP